MDGQQAPSVTPMTPEMNPTYAYTRPEADFVRKTVMIPMRDGKKLFTVIVMRKGARNAPILFTRTPYNADKTTSRTPSQRIVDILPLMDAEFVNDNYIRVYQDVRGRNKSEGDFVMNRPIRGPLNTSEAIEKDVMQKLPQAGFKVEQAERVGALVGGELAKSSLWALGIGILGILMCNIPSTPFCLPA